jgi:cation diffusion facilitator CzcD-associated flavoprotein CzcO
MESTNAVREPAAPIEHFDVLIVGAGLSGIAAAYHLRTSSPGKRFAILEGRAVVGGTWDLFRYPGVRSDSDMHTLGYAFRPWPSEKTIAEGSLIRDYITDTARATGIDRAIRFETKVVGASWSSAEARWTVDIEAGPEKRHSRLSCAFLFMCTGYYDYSQGYTPEWPDMDRYTGKLIHPQFWDETYDYAGKRVAIIGSGATAVTLAPAMAEKAGHVTIVQRSPSYVVARPAVDGIARRLQARLPSRIAGPIVRWKNILYSIFTFDLARKRPATVAKLIHDAARAYLGPDYEMDPHFKPTYNPWDQRVCLVPDADLFKAIRAGRVEVVTDHIERFTETGLLLKSGRHVEADVIVTATGLKVQLMGGTPVRVDGKLVDFGKTLYYKGMMFSDVPNFASAFGYTNASWTLKCELTAQYVCRLLNYMTKEGFDYCTPRRPQAMAEEPGLDFKSGYVLRAVDVIPKQGTVPPWRNHQNYIADMMALRFGKLVDGKMVFSKIDRSNGAASAHRAGATELQPA